MKIQKMNTTNTMNTKNENSQNPDDDFVVNICPKIITSDADKWYPSYQPNTLKTIEEANEYIENHKKDNPNKFHYRIVKWAKIIIHEE